MLNTGSNFPWRDVYEQSEMDAINNNPSVELLPGGRPGAINAARQRQGAARAQSMGSPWERWFDTLRAQSGGVTPAVMGLRGLR